MLLLSRYSTSMPDRTRSFLGEMITSFRGLIFFFKHNFFFSTIEGFTIGLLSKTKSLTWLVTTEGIQHVVFF